MGRDGGTWGERVGTVLRQGAADVTRLVLPVRCPGCGQWDELLCRGCAVPLAGPVRRCEGDAPRLDVDPARLRGLTPLPVWTVTTYDGPVRGIVTAWKERGRADLGPVLVAAVRTASAELTSLVAAAQGARLHVVPVPPSWGARRRRGADLVALLAQGVTAGLRTAGGDASPAPVLRRSRTRDQVGLGARARSRNSTGTARVAGRGRLAPGALCVLVDDVLTTGSTLAACEAALSASGGLVLGAVVLAATPPPDRRAVEVSATAAGG